MLRLQMQQPATPPQQPDAVENGGAGCVEQYLREVWAAQRQADAHIRLYRGQPQRWDLLPSLFRPPSGAEIVETAEAELLSRFKNESPYLLPSKPDNDWDWLSLGQHFGLPTRLLDWTANPLTALFFAIECEKPTAPVVYIYDASKDQIVSQEDKSQSPFSIKHTKIVQPTGHSVRVAMQAGWHTVFRKEAGKGVTPLNKVPRHDLRTTAISVDPKSAAKLRAELADMGIKPATVYGDLPSVCAFNGLINDTIEINRMFTEHVDRMAQICGSCADAVDSPEPVHADPAGISLKVRILSGPATGRSGWVRATQVVLPAKMPGAAPGATTAKQ